MSNFDDLRPNLVSPFRSFESLLGAELSEAVTNRGSLVAALQIRAMINGATEFNIPVFKENCEVVASEDRGFHNPSVLVFNSSRGSNEAPKNIKKFNYPSLCGVQRPTKEDDIAFMTVLELGALIRTKQITSLELTNIFIRRLNRCEVIYVPSYKTTLGPKTFKHQMADGRRGTNIRDRRIDGADHDN